MNNNERQIIHELFSRLQKADDQTIPCDEQALQLIKEYLEKQPNAPYYMTQVIFLQEEALKKLNKRIQELEKNFSKKDTRKGILSKLFGIDSFSNQNSRNSLNNYYDQSSIIPQKFNPSNSLQPISFMNSAARTAIGVASGLVIGDMLKDIFHLNNKDTIVDIIHSTPMHNHHMADNESHDGNLSDLDQYDTISDSISNVEDDQNYCDDTSDFDFDHN